MIMIQEQMVHGFNNGDYSKFAEDESDPGDFARQQPDKEEGDQDRPPGGLFVAPAHRAS